MAAYLLVHDEVETAGLVLEFGEPALEAQEPHASALPTVKPELSSAAGDSAIRTRNRVAGGGS